MKGLVFRNLIFAIVCKWLKGNFCGCQKIQIIILYVKRICKPFVKLKCPSVKAIDLEKA